jgi:hypothetical protein
LTLNAQVKVKIALHVTIIVFNFIFNNAKIVIHSQDQLKFL